MLAPQIEEDRGVLLDLMERMGTSKNPAKQATTWLAEKASRPKFSGLTSGEPALGTFMDRSSRWTSTTSSREPSRNTMRSNGSASRRAGVP